jgi:hypothetical protein
MIAAEIAKGFGRVVTLSLRGKVGRFRSWPSRALVIDEPLALAEERTNRLERIYQKCTANVWDGPTVFRDAVHRHGGIQLSRDKRVALSHVIATLMWGELGAWIVSAELAERLDDADARMAASSQVFDEARHFYILRDYMALLHVPVPALDPFFVAGVRSLLTTKDLTIKLMAMQILAEGAAQSIFSFLAEKEVEPVLTEILPYIERDEARHVGLGILHLPERLARLSPRQCRKLAQEVYAIGDMFGLSAVKNLPHYETLGLDPRDLFKRADGLLTNLAEKLGNVPGTDQRYFRTDDPRDPRYEEKLRLLFPEPGATRNGAATAIRGLVDLGSRYLPV